MLVLTPSRDSSCWQPAVTQSHVDSDGTAVPHGQTKLAKLQARKEAPLHVRQNRPHPQRPCLLLTVRVALLLRHELVMQRGAVAARTAEEARHVVQVFAATQKAAHVGAETA